MYRASVRVYEEVDLTLLSIHVFGYILSDDTSLKVQILLLTIPLQMRYN